MREIVLSAVASARAQRRRAYRLRRDHYRASRENRAERQREARAAKRIEDLTQERDALRDGVLRARAELDNVRKRTERDRAEILQRAGEELLSDLLPVLDNFHRAIEAAQNTTDVKAMLNGVEMIRDQMRAVLTRHGLEPVEALGQTFDPALHEAVAVEERGDAENNRIVAVIREGFRLHGRLLRPAMVRVAKRPR